MFEHELLDLGRRKLTCSPAQLREVLAKLGKSEDFVALPGSVSPVDAV